MSETKENDLKSYDILSKEYVNASFKASVGVSVIKQDKWVNISLSLFGGRTFLVNNKKGMSVQLRPLAVKELIKFLQQASDIQFDELSQQKEELEGIELPEEW